MQQTLYYLGACVIIVLEEGLVAIDQHLIQVVEGHIADIAVGVLKFAEEGGDIVGGGVLGDGVARHVGGGR